jgi:hypothetical protein
MEDQTDPVVHQTFSIKWLSSYSNDHLLKW